MDEKCSESQHLPLIEIVEEKPPPYESCVYLNPFVGDKSEQDFHKSFSCSIASESCILPAVHYSPQHLQHDMQTQRNGCVQEPCPCYAVKSSEDSTSVSLPQLKSYFYWSPRNVMTAIGKTALCTVLFLFFGWFCGLAASILVWFNTFEEKSLGFQLQRGLGRLSYGSFIAGFFCGSAMMMFYGILAFSLHQDYRNSWH